MATPVIEAPLDLPAEQYHAHPALSASGAKLLLPPSCPAKYRYAMDHPRPPKREFDLGHAAHRVVLGAGADLVRIEALDYRTKAAQQQRDEAYDAGRIPLLPREHEQVKAMASAVLEHPLAAALFDPARGGKPEQSLFWTDDETGVPRRARPDWLRPNPLGRVVVPDYKTAKSADRATFGRSLYEYGYDIQADTYVSGVLACGLAEEAVFVFVVQEKEPPYLISLYYPDDTAMRIGRTRNLQAMQVWRQCTEDDDWPGYGADPEPISLPYYIERQYEESDHG